VITSPLALQKNSLCFSSSLREDPPTTSLPTSFNGLHPTSPPASGRGGRGGQKPTHCSPYQVCFFSPVLKSLPQTEALWKRFEKNSLPRC